MLSKQINHLLTAALSAFFISCGSMDAYEKNTTIPHYKWERGFVPEFTLEVTDTTSLYQSLMILRHTHAYAYKNIWIELSTILPGDTVSRSEKIELTLQKSNGEWYGSGFSDIRELRYPLFTNLRFRKPGIYTIRIKQIMRDNPLEEVMSTGIRIEKIQP